MNRAFGRSEGRIDWIGSHCAYLFIYVRCFRREHGLAAALVVHESKQLECCKSPRIEMRYSLTKRVSPPPLKIYYQRTCPVTSDSCPELPRTSLNRSPHCFYIVY